MITIRIWHGDDGSKEYKALIAKILALGAQVTGHPLEYDLSLSLQEFVQQWDEKFIAYPIDKATGHWLVGLTQHGSFNAR